MAEELSQTAAAAAWLLERLVIGGWVSSSALKAEAISLGFSASAHYGGWAAQRVGLAGRRLRKVYTATDPYADCVLTECVELQDLKGKDER